MKAESFEDLEVWKEGMRLTVEVSSQYYLNDVVFYCKLMIFRQLSSEYRTSKYEQLLMFSLMPLW